MSYISFENVVKKYDKNDRLSVDNFCLDIKQGEFIVFVGPSGCGKSTTLRMLAGLEKISGGTISIDGEVVNDLHPKDRHVAMVFQNYALYPHMTVADNIIFGMKKSNFTKEEMQEKMLWATDILGLSEFLNKRPGNLSGGQKQRVALARAIVRNPKVFLMDEPLSNLDAKLRVSTRNEIIKLHESLGATSIYVTHDQVEAMTMADRVVIMKDGIIQQIGTPEEIYTKPINKFVAIFIGSPQMNLIDAKIKDGNIVIGEKTIMSLPEGIIKKLPNGLEDVEFGFRPEHVSNKNLEIESFPEQVFDFKIDNFEYLGNETYVYTSLENNDIILRINGKINNKKHDQMKVRIDANKIYLFSKETGMNLLID